MEINPILELMHQKRNGHYVHALGVDNVWQLESILSEIYDEFITNYSHSDIVDFCSTLSIYCDDDDESDEVYDFDIEQFINNL